MKNFRHDNPQLFEAFIKSTQYFVRLKTQQDVWDHLAKFIMAYFPSDWVAFVHRDPVKGISVQYCTSPDRVAGGHLLAEGVRTVVAEVLDSGFLASQVIGAPAPAMTAFLPIGEGPHPQRVMLIGHKAADALPDELLNIYLALAGLAGATAERLATERELNQHRVHLEELVKERTAELLKAKRQNELILNSVAEGICGMDMDGTITFVNPSAARLLGREANELIGRNAHATFHQERRSGCAYPAEECPVYAALKNGSRQRLGDEEFLRGDGTHFPVELVTTPILEGAHVVGGVVVFRDITERKQAEELARISLREKEALLGELARSNKDLEQFAYVASHDLQEPLRTVAGFVELLRKDPETQLSPNAETYINYAVEGTLRMRTLIGDLLAYSRVGAKPVAFQETDSMQALNRALEGLHSTLQETGATVTQGALPTLKADAGQLTQVFQNLIGNAVKFRGDQPPQVRVDARREPEAWLFSVADNGIGIDAEFKEKIFMIFQRLHRRSVYPGTGIGLAICKKIVERHGGRIWVESQLGKGATLYFTIPDRE